MSKLNFYRKDPLAAWLIGRLRLTPAKGGIIGFIGYSILGYGLGLWLSFVYINDTGVDKIWLGPQLLSALMVLIVLPTFLWWFYIYQITEFLHVVETITLGDDLAIAGIEKRFNQLRWSVYAFLAAVIVCVGWYTLIAIPAMAPRQSGFYFPWWYMNPYYCYSIFLPIIALEFYLGVIISIRQILAIKSLNILFKHSEPNIHPLHPDGAGGLASVGSFAINTAFVGILVGVWAVTLTNGPIQRGLEPEPPWFTLGLLVLYIVLTPVLLITPVWTTHIAMKTVKYKMLAKISEDFDKKVKNIPKRGNRINLNEDLEQLIKIYQIIQDTYPEWPFSTSALKKFGVTYFIPLVLQVASYVLKALSISLP